MPRCPHSGGRRSSISLRDVAHPHREVFCIKKFAIAGSAAALVAASLFGATAAQAADIPNPEGVLLDTVTATMTADSPILDLNNSDGWVNDNGNLGGQEVCNFDSGDSHRNYSR